MSLTSETCTVNCVELLCVVYVEICQNLSTHAYNYMKNVDFVN